MVSHQLFYIYKQYPCSILSIFVVLYETRYCHLHIMSGITDLQLQTHFHFKVMTLPGMVLIIGFLEQKPGTSLANEHLNLIKKYDISLYFQYTKCRKVTTYIEFHKKLAKKKDKLKGQILALDWTVIYHGNLPILASKAMIAC